MGFGKLMHHTKGKISASHKYVLDAPFAAAADALSADYGTLVRAFPFCRLPFEQTWFEVAQSHRPQFCSAGIHAPQFQSKPRRVGFLCSATRNDLSAWKAHLFWVLPEIGCSAAGYAMQFDMTQGAATVYNTEVNNPLGSKHREFFTDSGLKEHPGWVSAGPSVRQALMQHTNIVVPDYGLPLVPEELMLRPQAEQDKIFSVIDELARSDWAGEVSFLLAVIGLLNARNVVERERVDLSRKNKARVKRGRRPFMEHSVLKIHRGQIKRAAAGQPSGTGHGPIRYHVCSGHFKVRKTGIFFWKPFWRGDPKRGTVTHDYEVVS
jgi:hypothetical protein